ncbi:hypothetical protein PV11_05001 [Exophiala sideris]|uniref:DNA (cytosine-5-)-methyltransferase n=1 Tax=Exophiala sideris TaxID=1016849 RepID=A0A0D1X5G0_9EURO|nr:hypothetical protein PV11_05001 [Exophiala sideris]
MPPTPSRPFLTRHRQPMDGFNDQIQCSAINASMHFCQGNSSESHSGLTALTKAIAIALIFIVTAWLLRSTIILVVSIIVGVKVNGHNLPNVNNVDRGCRQYSFCRLFRTTVSSHLRLQSKQSFHLPTTSSDQRYALGSTSLFFLPGTIWTPRRQVRFSSLSLLRFPFRSNMPPIWDLTQVESDSDDDVPYRFQRKIDIMSNVTGNVVKTKRGRQLTVSGAKRREQGDSTLDEAEWPKSQPDDKDSEKFEAAYVQLTSEEELVMGDQVSTPMTRSRSGVNIKAISTGAALPTATIRKRIAVLADELQELESPTDLNLLYPPQFSPTWRPEQPYRTEDQILEEFIVTEDQIPTFAEKDFLEFNLEDFCVYRAPGHPNGLEGQYENLVTVAAENNQRHWLVDGTLVHKGIQRHFVGAQITDMSIGGFEDLSAHSTDGLIWVMTVESGGRSYWYRLGKPTGAYSKHWTDFVWLAEFCKHFIDYLFDNPTRATYLVDFKTDFWKWLQSIHGDKLKMWHSKCGFQKDFRSCVLRHAQFLRNQAYSVYGDDRAKLLHPIWQEIGAGYDKQTLSPTEQTCVTANAAHTFLRTFPHWQTTSWAENRSQKLLKFLENAVTDKPFRPRCLDDLGRKVVIVRSELTNGQFEFRYAWVRAVSVSLKTVNVVWLVLPTEKIWGSKHDGIFYPIGNELFFTDECNCDAIMVKDIVKAIDASVFTDHAEEGSALFIHCLYRNQEQEGLFVNAVEDDLACRCRGRKNITSIKKKQQLFSEPQSRPKLQGLSLFSGTGLLDYGFGAPGYAETKVAVEHCEVAVRSYEANDERKRTRCIVGSVNAQFSKYMRGEEPMAQYHYIIAGCPCPGFSSRNANKNTLESQTNCSLLAHTLSWVEMFMPAYVIIENVKGMNHGRPSACAQAISYLVALGYQVRKMLCTVSHLGGASSRPRIIIIAAAPGVILPDAIPQTHSDNGSSIALRTSGQAISDLPELHNDTIINIMDPDHIPLHRLKVEFSQGVNFRNLVQQIPTEPSGMSLGETYRAGGLLPSQRDWYENLDDFKHQKSSKCLTRINRDKPFRTVCTVIAPMDSVSGGEVIHPFENRTISLKEARRAMDVPDRFLLVGSVRQQFEMLGNGVPWVLGAAIGRAVGKSWITSWERRTNRGARHVDTKEKESTLAARKFDDVYVSANLKRARHIVPNDGEEIRPSTRLKRTRCVVPSDHDGDGSPAEWKRTRRVVLDDDDDDDERGDSSAKLIGKRLVVSDDEKDNDQSDTSVEFIEERHRKKRPE